MRNSPPSQIHNAVIVQYAAWAPLTAFTATLVTVWWLARSRFSTIALDHPNRRSLHRAPVPRTGGIGLHVGILLAWGITAPALPLQVWFAFTPLLFISFIDDVRGVPIGLRLAVHLLAAGILAVGLLAQDFGLFAVLIATLAVAWMANLYNFMDGSDGLAGGMALFGFSFYGIAAWYAGNNAFALLNLSVAAAAAAFLVFNFHPARIFLGDVGSVPLGFLAAAFGLAGWLLGAWTWWFPPLLFSPFIVDASATLGRRLARRERVWEAHRDHYYQRLVQLGWGHRGTAFAEYALMLACGALGLAALSFSPGGQAAVLAVAAIAYIASIAAIERAWKLKAGGGARGRAGA
jgi:UDP-GlcNAc:undecaprenyl-phosphate/decaprenyl-phosphate GlcNAc-1-phosphate transferase